MSTEKLENYFYREYDAIVGATLSHIYTQSKNKGIIRLVDFDRKNMEHLFVLRIALMVRDIYQLPIEVKGSWWDVFRLNCKVRKNFKKVARIKESAADGINISHFLDGIRAEAENGTYNHSPFAAIYIAYYEGSLN